MTKDYSEILLNENASVKDAMKQLDIAAEKILFVVDKENKLIGSLSDGDIRRWILKDGALSDTVENACFKGTYFVYQDDDIEIVKNEMLKRQIVYVPVVDRLKTIVEIIFWDNIFEGKFESKVVKILRNPVIIMAGGKGTRLDPFTKILPKPLIPIGDKTILELIIEKFVNFGIGEFTLSVNYKAKIIKSYFEEVAPDYKINYLYEKQPLGTAGALSLINLSANSNIIVTNCDIIIDADYTDVVDFHENNGNDITLVASMKHIQIPYGVCKLNDEGLLEYIDEKPEFDYLISTGMYVLNSDLLELIPRNAVFQMTDLIKSAKDLGKKVGLYPISANSWIDTGEWVEYKKAVKKLLD